MIPTPIIPDGGGGDDGGGLKGFDEGTGEITYSVFRYVFQYKDHLGNVRLSYSDTNGNGAIDPNSFTGTEVIEESNYYPFGLKQRGYNATVSGGNDLAQQWKYNGVELEESLGLDLYEFELRQYDSAIGRFITPDPYEQFKSPYVAMGNNPIVAFDPDGGLCYDSNGNVIACPEGEEYDQFRDNNENNINILDEVVIVASDKSEEKNNDAYSAEISESEDNSSNNELLTTLAAALVISQTDSPAPGP